MIRPAIMAARLESGGQEFESLLARQLNQWLAQIWPSVWKSRANGGLTSKKNQVDEITKADPAVAIGN